MTSTNSVIDPQLKTVISQIASSFKLENTPESASRIASGETRNRKLIFIENYLKSKLGKSVVVSSASYAGSPYDVLASAEGGVSAFYMLKMDFDKSQIEIKDQKNKSDIINGATEDLKSLYRGKVIESITSNINNMTLTIKYRTEKFSSAEYRTYKVDVSYEGGKFTWDLNIQDNASSLSNFMRLSPFAMATRN
jgi:hypothetical protein